MFFSVYSFLNIAFSEPETSLLELENHVKETSEIFSLMQKNVLKREGVLGAVAAERLYNRALRSFMLKNYEESMLLFFVLVKDGSLQYDMKSHYKAQWFLIESADAFGSSLVLEEECLEVAKQEKHPFFTEAIRRLLELYGRTGQDIKFQKIVQVYVDSGKVENTDNIRYTLGKSFFWQNKGEKAKELLSKIVSTSIFFDKAQYFLGGIYASGGEYEQALSLFVAIEERLQEKAVSDKVLISSPSVGSASLEEQNIYELAIIARARVLLEIESFDEAIASYARMPSTSVYYPDVIYELVWVYIKKKAWQDASRMIDIFLYGYPEHEYAIRLELIRGRIQMNAGNNEQASKTFADGKKSLEEVDALLSSLIGNEEAALSLFLSLRDEANTDPFSLKAFQATDISKLPDFAKDMLTAEKDLQRAILISRDMLQEFNELQGYQKDLLDMQSFLAQSNSLGAIQREKREVSEFRVRILALLYKALSLEFQYVKEGADSPSKKSIEQLERDWLQKNRSFLSLSENQSDSFIEAHRVQVLAVQNEAEALLSQVASLNQELNDVLQKYDKQQFSPSQQSLIDSLNAEISTEISQVHSGLTDIISPSKTMLILGYVKSNTTASQKRDKKFLEDWKQTHEKDLAPFWTRSSPKKSQLDSIWSTLSPLLGQLEGIDGKLEEVQKKQIGKVHTLLEQEISRVDSLVKDYQKAQGGVDLISLEAARQGFANIQELVTKNILEADLGLVKIQWNRFIQKESLLLSLQDEKKQKETKNKNEFDIIKSKLPLSSVKDVGAP